MNKFYWTPEAIISLENLREIRITDSNKITISYKDCKKDAILVTVDPHGTLQHIGEMLMKK